MGQVWSLAGITGRGWRPDLPQASLPGVRIGQAPEAVDAELHRRVSEGRTQRQEQQGKGRGMSRPGAATPVPSGTCGDGRPRPWSLVAITAVGLAPLGAPGPAPLATAGG